MLEFMPYETIHVHHNGRGHFCTSTSIGGKVRLYDSLSLPPSKELIAQLTSLYSPDPETCPEISLATIECKQLGVHDCGLFALAYTYDLAHGEDPSMYKYNQDKFRDHLIECLTSNKMLPFPKVATHTVLPKPRTITGQW